MDNLLEMDASLVDIIDDQATKSVIDNALDAVADIEQELTNGEALSDGDIIDAVALSKDTTLDNDTIKFADDQEEDDHMIKAVQDGETDPDDAAYEKEYPELHNDDPNDDGDDISEEDFENISMDECGLNSNVVDVILEVREEIESEDD